MAAAAAAAACKLCGVERIRCRAKKCNKWVHPIDHWQKANPDRTCLAPRTYLAAPRSDLSARRKTSGFYFYCSKPCMLQDKCWEPDCIQVMCDSERRGIQRIVCQGGHVEQEYRCDNHGCGALQRYTRPNTVFFGCTASLHTLFFCRSCSLTCTFPLFDTDEKNTTESPTTKKRPTILCMECFEAAGPPRRQAFSLFRHYDAYLRWHTRMQQALWSTSAAPGALVDGLLPSSSSSSFPASSTTPLFAPTANSLPDGVQTLILNYVMWLEQPRLTSDYVAWKQQQRPLSSCTTTSPPLSTPAVSSSTLPVSKKSSSPSSGPSSGHAANKKRDRDAPRPPTRVRAHADSGSGDEESASDSSNQEDENEEDEDERDDEYADEDQEEEEEEDESNESSQNDDDGKDKDGSTTMNKKRRLLSNPSAAVQLPL